MRCAARCVRPVRASVSQRGCAGVAVRVWAEGRRRRDERVVTREEGRGREASLRCSAVPLRERSALQWRQKDRARHKVDLVIPRSHCEPPT